MELLKAEEVLDALIVELAAEVLEPVEERKALELEAWVEVLDELGTVEELKALVVLDTAAELEVRDAVLEALVVLETGALVLLIGAEEEIADVVLDVVTQ